jgi:hypothetical protein
MFRMRRRFRSSSLCGEFRNLEGVRLLLGILSGAASALCAQTRSYFMPDENNVARRTRSWAGRSNKDRKTTTMAREETFMGKP